MRTRYDSDMEVLKKGKDSLLQDCERYREVGWLSILIQQIFPVLGYLVVYSLSFRLFCSDCVVKSFLIA